ncbi:MAG: DNA replication/repair protein RecF [Desulfuromonadales bacterium]|nr:DNA replication/repair protein RecF [Desulfuromonadales bacterium]NIR33176.1 DNA replication/repair protein RecF [Desulfuromonadales bacterium]NIS39400.1 DNA replication/repair protein RecF [Desulfuromonadales bacterium]
MKFKALAFRNFRNLDDVEVEASPGLNVIWGDNAQGKTNFLEGIYLLGNGKSFRTARNEQLIGHGATHSRLSGKIFANRVDNTIELQIDAQSKRFSINNKGIGSVDEIIALNRQILFFPEDVAIARGSPSGRRNLIDRAIFLSRPAYLRQVQDYNRLLRHRNQLLKENAESPQMTVWTEQLARSGAAIRCRRREFVASFQGYLRQAHARLSAHREEADILLPSGSGDLQTATEELAQDLQRLGGREARLGMTLAGPHRDDPQFHVDGLDLRRYGSQGQQRSFILAFKTALVNFLEDAIGASPILLLDDITSELDRQRKESFLGYLLDRGGQVFITTTDLASLLPEGLPGAAYYKVDKGRIFTEERVN